MEVLTITFLPYAMWPLLSLAMVVLWTVAMVDITVHKRRGTLTSAGLLYMVATVAAIIAVAGIGAVFAGQRFEAVSGAGKDIPRHAYLFSFGLEHASYATPGKPKSTK